jgi:prepilin-type N-terminal cleavage/methylation domain-containing protein
METHPMNTFGRRQRRRLAKRRGFTLLETMLTLVIVTVGVAAVFDSYSAFTIANEWSSRTATAELLANEIREFTRTLPRHDPVTGLDVDDDAATVYGWGLEPGEILATDIDDIDDLDGIRFIYSGADLQNLEMPGPIDAGGNVVDQYIINSVDRASGDAVQFGWIQTVTVTKVHPFDYAEVLDADFSEDADGDFRGRDADDYPLRISVTVGYQGSFDADAQDITTLSWIVP